MSVIGQEYKQPRVFAHDAWPVVVGAINYTWNTNKKFPGKMNYAGIIVTDAGDGGVNPYVVGDTITLSAGSGTVPGVLTVDAIDSDGLVTDFSFDPTTASNLGAGYVVGDSLTQAATTSAAGTGFECDVNNIDIPNTQEAGCCLYFSPAAAAAANITVIMEAAKWDGSAGDGYPAADVKTFTLVPAGIFLPILVKQVTSATVVNDILALY
jgi:hypothetical protein